MDFSVTDLFEAAADRVPDREILVCGSERRSFAQLDGRANRLAHYLQSVGISRGQHLGGTAILSIAVTASVYLGPARTTVRPAARLDTKVAPS